MNFELNFFLNNLLFLLVQTHKKNNPKRQQTIRQKKNRYTSIVYM